MRCSAIAIYTETVGAPDPLPPKRRKPAPSEGASSGPEELNHRIEHLLNVATDVFLNDGFERASMNKIARLAGASKETFYSRYATKVELFHAVVSRRTCRILGRFDQLVAGHQAPEVVLTEFGHQLTQVIFHSETLNLLHLLLAESRRFNELAERFWQEGPGRGRRRVAQYLKALVERGEMAIDDPELAAEQFFGLVLGDNVLRSALNLPLTDMPSLQRARVESAVRVFMQAYRRSESERNSQG